MQKFSKSCLPEISVGRGSVFGTSSKGLKEDPLNMSSEPVVLNNLSNNGTILDQSSVSNDLELFRNVSLAKKLALDSALDEEKSDN